MASKIKNPIGENEQEKLIIKKSSSLLNHVLGYVVNISMIVWFLCYPFNFSLSLIIPLFNFWILFALGYFIWTFVEYWLHRGPYHHKPETFRVGHMLHHKYPKALLGVPFYITTVPIIIIFFLLSSIIGYETVGSFLAGFWLGYVIYTLLHHSTHYLSIKLPYLYFVRRHHLQHHVHDDKNFGFTTNLWDIVFRTKYNPKKKEKD